MMPNPIDPQTKFCLACARAAFRVWRGWCSYGTEHWNQTRKEKLALPDLPRMQKGECPQCRSTESVIAESIYYRNEHGPGNTGLPDYFVLEIVEAGEYSRCASQRKWGRPFVDGGTGRIPWMEMLQRIEKFKEEEERARAWSEINEDWISGPRCSDPTFWNYEPKACPADAVVAEKLVALCTRWPDIVGENLAAITRPLKFTGDKKRCLVVWADGRAEPPWGDWSSLSSFRPKRRAFTDFRAAINKAIAPMEVDHVQFFTDGLDSQRVQE